MKKRMFTRIVASLLAILTGTCFLAVSAFADVYFSAESLFTSRDLRQEANLSKAVSLAVSDGQDIRIDSAGVYVLAGTASEATVYVEAGHDDKVQLVLDGVSITNTGLNLFKFD